MKKSTKIHSRFLIIISIVSLIVCQKSLFGHTGHDHNPQILEKHSSEQQNTINQDKQ